MFANVMAWFVLGTCIMVRFQGRLVSSYPSPPLAFFLLKSQCEGCLGMLVAALQGLGGGGAG